MDALTPPTLVVAMEQLDSEVAVLVERRRLLQQLLATFDDADGNTVGWHQVERTPLDASANEQFAIVDAAPPAPKPAKAAPKAKAPTNAGRKLRKWDYAEVGAVANAGIEAGTTAAKALAEHYDLNDAMARFLVKRCREQGYLDDPNVSFVPTPIERAPFDPEVARDAAAGPKTGPVRGFGGQPGRRTDLDPQQQTTGPASSAPFTTADALAALEAS